MFSISNKQKSVDWFIYFVFSFENITNTHLDMKISISISNQIEEIFGGFTEIIQQKHRIRAQNEDMTKFK